MTLNSSKVGYIKPETECNLLSGSETNSSNKIRTVIIDKKYNLVATFARNRAMFATAYNPKTDQQLLILDIATNKELLYLTKFNIIELASLSAKTNIEYTIKKMIHPLCVITLGYKSQIICMWMFCFITYIPNIV